MRQERLYRNLLSAFGPQGWWPARTQFEIAVGAILTQQARWSNVEKAIAELRCRKLLTPKAMSQASEGDIRPPIRGTGFYRQKARRLKTLAGIFPRIQRCRTKPTAELRERLLALDGVGPETADSILLYAFNRAILPIDAYTIRVTKRIYGVEGDYETLRLFYERNLPKKAAVLSEFHALIVELAKRYCKKKPGCGSCPVGKCKYKIGFLGHRPNSKLK